MSKYIKLDTAIEHTNQLYHGDEVEAWLENLPTIDIVRCGECKFWKESRPTSEDDFCSCGVRSEK